MFSHFDPPKPRCKEYSCTLCAYYQWLSLTLSGVGLFPNESGRAWGAETGVHHISHLYKNFRRHLSQSHRARTTPDGYAKHVKTLTDLLVRMDTYPVAYGGFSNIWSCLLQRNKSSPERVAVKAIRWMTMNTEEFPLKQKAIQKELRVWAQLEHPNVLPLYGVTGGFGPFDAFVSPWADHGTLSEYLEKFELCLDLRKRLKLLRDIAAGLCYLHSRHVVHGDLSGSNVLVTGGGRAVVSDFGLSIPFDTTESGSSFPGNIRWAAPELLDACVEGSTASQLASRQADVYSFGSVMLQILTGKLPFHGIQRVSQIVIMISQGNRPAREPSWDGKAIPNALWHFMEKCWASTPSKRPSCRHIVAFIKYQLGKRKRAVILKEVSQRRSRRTCNNSK